MSDPVVTIRENTGLWLVNVRHGRNEWARHAWTRERAEAIAADLVVLARSFAQGREVLE